MQVFIYYLPHLQSCNVHGRSVCVSICFCLEAEVWDLWMSDVVKGQGQNKSISIFSLLSKMSLKSRSKVTMIKNIKMPIFCLLSEYEITVIRLRP